MNGREFTRAAFAAWLDKHRSIQKGPRVNEGATLADEIEQFILRWHSADVREWWNMRDGSPVKGAWNFYFGRHPELGDALLVRIAELRSKSAE